MIDLTEAEQNSTQNGRRDSKRATRNWVNIKERNWRLHRGPNYPDGTDHAIESDENGKGRRIDNIKREDLGNSREDVYNDYESHPNSSTWNKELDIQGQIKSFQAKTNVLRNMGGWFIILNRGSWVSLPDVCCFFRGKITINACDFNITSIYCNFSSDETTHIWDR